MRVGYDYIGVGCGAIVVNDNNEVLLVKRSLESRTEPGEWSRPGGEVERGETIEKAVEREVFEETGVRVQVVRLLEVTQNISEGKHWIALGYLAKYVSGEAVNREPKKHDEVKWCPIDNIPGPLNNYTRNSLNIYLQTEYAGKI